MFIRTVDAISEVTGKLAAWMFFAVGIFVTFEVVMRYVFTAPTIWVDDVSRYFQIWATYIAGAFVLKHRQMVVIEIFFKDHTTTWRKITETFAIVMILFFCAVAIKFGYDVWLQSLLSGKRSSTMLAAPMWAIQSAIWVGFGLLFLQAVVEGIRVWTVGVPPDEGHGAH